MGLEAGMRGVLQELDPDGNWCEAEELLQAAQPLLLLPQHAVHLLVPAWRELG